MGFTNHISGRTWVGILVTTSAIALFLTRPHFEWIANATDAIGLTILGLAMLPWLGTILESLSIAGFGEAKFRQIEQRIENAEEAIDNSREINASANVINDTSDDNSLPADRLKSLSVDYVSTRKSMPSSNERTEKMATLFAQMRMEVRKIGKSNFDPSEGLNSDDPGENLAAIAYGYTFVDDFNMDEMIGLINSSKQPFVQFWGLRAIQNSVSSAGLAAFSAKNIEDLRSLEKLIKPRTDRAYTIGRIVKGINRALEAK